MTHRTLLIVGIDPGTTLGYAAIDFKGNVLEMNSSKLMSFELLIKTVTSIGKPVIVATDKRNVPGYVEEFARKTGAKIIKPREDLKIVEKRNLTHGYAYKDYHQMDSLAAALYALRLISPLMHKIEKGLQEGINVMKSSIIEEVILHEKSVDHALKQILEKEEKIKIIEKKVPVPLMTSNNGIDHYKIKKIENENTLLKNMIDQLKNKIKTLEDEKHYLLRKKEHVEYGSKHQKIMKFREKREINFLNEIRNKNMQIKSLQDELITLNQLIANIKTKIIIKKLQNLGINEFEKMQNLLNIEEGDILMVEHPEIVSEKVLEYITKHHLIIITSKMISTHKPFIFIDKNKIKLTETKYFAVADKKEIDNQISAKQMLHKIVENYQMFRS